MTLRLFDTYTRSLRNFAPLRPPPIPLLAPIIQARFPESIVMFSFYFDIIFVTLSTFLVRISKLCSFCLAANLCERIQAILSMH